MSSLTNIIEMYKKFNKGMKDEYENPILIDDQKSTDRITYDIIQTETEYAIQEQRNLAYFYNNFNDNSSWKRAIGISSFSQYGMYYKDKRVCNFTVEVVKYVILLNDDNEVVGKEYQIKISNRNKSSMINKASIEELREPAFYRKLVEFPNLVVDNAAGFKAVMDAIIEEIDLPAETIWLHGGWQNINGRWYYLDKNGAVGCPEIKANCRQDISLGISGDIVANDIQMLLSVAGKKSLLLMLYSVISILYRFFDIAGFKPRFALFLSGHTNSFKTSVAVALTKIIGRKRGIQSPNFSFHGTAAGLESGFAEHHDLVYLIDDLFPSDDRKKKKQMESNLELISRLLGDGFQKNRNTDFMPDEQKKKIDYKVRGGVMFTGEYFTGIESTISRLLILNINAGDVDLKKLKYLQDNPEILIKFYASFIKFACEKQADIIRYIAESVPGMRDEFMGQYSKPRYAEAAALIYTAVEILSAFLSAVGFYKIDEFRQEAINIINEVVGYTDHIVKRKSKEYLIIQALRAYLDEIQTGKPEKRFEVIDKGNYVCLAAASAHEIVTGYLASQGIQDMFASDEEFSRFCASKGLVLIKQEQMKNGKPKNRYTHKLSGNKRYLFFFKDRIFSD